MAVTADRPAPYAPIKAILGIIDRYRNRGMASPISADVLARAGISDSLISRTLQALVTLDLINEDDDARRIDARQHGTQERFHVAQPAKVVKRLTTSPNGEPRRLFDDLPLAFPEIFRVQLPLDQRDR